MTRDQERAADVWARLRQWTPARIGLGRAGGSLPTRALLEFELDHARARDAVQAEMDAEALVRELRASGLGEATVVRSQVRDRMEYLLRPDLGRKLDEESRARLRGLPGILTSGQTGARRGAPVVVVADGLSAVAPERHAVGVLREFAGTENVTIVVANGARVALGDEIGELLGAEAVVMLIGERPGLSSPDSLGMYLTWAPRVGRTDAERNCISNVRPEGLPYAEAARRLRYLVCGARRLGFSGVRLKDDSGGGELEAGSGADLRRND